MPLSSASGPRSYGNNIFFLLPTQYKLKFVSPEVKKITPFAAHGGIHDLASGKSSVRCAGLGCRPTVRSGRCARKRGHELAGIIRSAGRAQKSVGFVRRKYKLFENVTAFLALEFIDRHRVTSRT
jgi:hypothetical protein